jgi:hypothetical protein
MLAFAWHKGKKQWKIQGWITGHQTLSSNPGLSKYEKVVKNTIFWDITPCTPLNINWHFSRTYHLHLKGRISQARYQYESKWQEDGRKSGINDNVQHVILYHPFSFTVEIFNSQFNVLCIRDSLALKDGTQKAITNSPP